MIVFIIIIALILLFIAFLQTPRFGKLPTAERMALINQSPNYRDGKFQNLNHTPALTEGESYYSVMKKFFFEKNKHGMPPAILPSVKTDLFSLDPSKNTLVWFGHSSYFLQVDGKKILVDPVFSGHASPVTFTTKSFNGADVYSTDDIPDIDYLFISHDHWDHLDYRTIIKLKNKVGKIICGLGVGAHFEKWGFDQHIIFEKDWNETVLLDEGFKVQTLPARHFSGRGLKRNTSLWLSFAFTTPTMKIYLGGDSGYDTHFKKIGEENGPFDLAILECGQYDKSWKYIHMLPTEVVQAAIDLKAAILMPVHWAKFQLANHAWNDPIKAVTGAASQNNMPLITPEIGEPVDLNLHKVYAAWWEDVT